MKPQLSTRQAQIAAAVADGKTNKEIARDLGLSRRTVEEHIRIAAEKVSGHGWPRYRLALWFLEVSSD